MGPYKRDAWSGNCIVAQVLSFSVFWVSNAWYLTLVLIMCGMERKLQCVLKQVGEMKPFITRFVSKFIIRLWWYQNIFHLVRKIACLEGRQTWHLRWLVVWTTGSRFGDRRRKKSRKWKGWTQLSKVCGIGRLRNRPNRKDRWESRWRGCVQSYSVFGVRRNSPEDVWHISEIIYCQTP